MPVFSNPIDVPNLPEGPWMRRLKEGAMIWLSKEQQYAKVVFPWMPDQSGYRCGRLVLERLWFQNTYDGYQWGVASVQKWFVGSRGEGLDGKQLIQPCEGHLPEEFAKVIEENAADLLMKVERMEGKIQNLENKVSSLEYALWCATCENDEGVDYGKNQPGF